VRGVIIGALASPLWLIVMGGVGSSDGSAAAGIVFIPILGAVVGLLLGFAIPLLWHVPKLWIGLGAGSVAGVLLWALTVTVGHAPSVEDLFLEVCYGAVVGFLLGCVILPLWRLCKFLSRHTKLPWRARHPAN
jgi:hypothetical protein